MEQAACVEFDLCSSIADLVFRDKDVDLTGDCLLSKALST